MSKERYKIQGNPEEEYKEASNNMRLYANLHAVKLTVFVTVTGGLVYLVFSTYPPFTTQTKLLFEIAGLFVSVLFGVNIMSDLYMWGHFLRRAASMEKNLGYGQYSSLPGAPKFKIRPGTWAIAMFCLCVFLFWLVTLIKSIY